MRECLETTEFVCIRNTFVICLWGGKKTENVRIAVLLRVRADIFGTWIRVITFYSLRTVVSKVCFRRTKFLSSLISVSFSYIIVGRHTFIWYAKRLSSWFSSLATPWCCRKTLTQITITFFNIISVSPFTNIWHFHGTDLQRVLSLLK
jgi:hypothetical protein